MVVLLDWINWHSMAGWFVQPAMLQASTYKMISSAIEVPKWADIHETANKGVLQLAQAQKVSMAIRTVVGQFVDAA